MSQDASALTRGQGAVIPPGQRAHDFSRLLSPRGTTGAIIAETLRHVQVAEPGLVVWTGPAGFGKSVATRQLRGFLQQQLPASVVPTQYLQLAGELDRPTGRGMHRSICDLHLALIPASTPQLLRALPAAAIIEDILEQFVQEGTRLLILDEAGTKSAAELRGIAQLVDAAIERQYQLHILLVSMDDITPKLARYKVLESRVTLDRDFPAWRSEHVLDLLKLQSAELAQFLEAHPPEAAAAATVCANEARGDLRLTGAVARDLAAVVVSAEPSVASQRLCDWVKELFTRHWRAREARTERAREMAPRRRAREKV